MLIVAVLAPVVTFTAFLGWTAGTIVRCVRGRRWATKASDFVLGAIAFIVGTTVYAVTLVGNCAARNEGWWLCEHWTQPVAVGLVAAVAAPMVRAIVVGESRSHSRGAKVVR